MRFFTTPFPVVLLLCASALPSLAATRTVQPGQSIQRAVNAANPGDTILVKGGTYSEQVLIETNANGVPLNGLTLVGTNGATLNGPGVQATNGIDVEANNVTVHGFTVEQYNSGFDVGTINAVSNVRIFNNYITNNLSGGIFLDSGLSGGDIYNNVVTASGALIGGGGGNSGFGDGVSLNLCIGVHVHSNLIYSVNSVGIVNSGQVLTDNNGLPIASSINLIDHNFITRCGGGGIYLNGAIGQTVTQNVVSFNTFVGILVTNFSANCTVSYNVLDGNSYDGLELDAAGGTQSLITNNVADYNGHDGFEVVYAPELSSNTSNVFSYDEAGANKNFDAEDVSPAGTNTWTHDQFGRTNPPNLGK